jgi:hypothetical protein
MSQGSDHSKLLSILPILPTDSINASCALAWPPYRIPTPFELSDRTLATNAWLAACLLFHDFILSGVQRARKSRAVQWRPASFVGLSLS